MAGLSESQLQHFEEYGFVKVEKLMPQSVLDDLMEEYGGVLDSLIEDLYAEGTISSTYEGLPFGERLTAVYQDSGNVYSQNFDFHLPGGATEADTPFWTGPAVFRALTQPDVLDVVESLIGPEIYSNPVQHVRIKPPERLAPQTDDGFSLIQATPWHQDHGVVMPEADETNMLTVWFSLLDAPVESGCLQVIPRSHRRELLMHCTGDAKGIHLPDQILELESAVPMPMKAGDVLFMHRHTCHGSLSNVSDSIRWSFDIRYNPSDQPTGRGFLPGFVARSRRDPASELRDAATWNQMWLDTRARLAAQTPDEVHIYRWDGEAAVCA